MCSAFTPDCGYDNSTIILIGDVSCPNTKCSVRLCLHKKTFQSFGRSDYQCPQCVSVCQVRKNLFEDQTSSFFLSLGEEVYTFEESSKSVQDVIRDVYCPGKYCSNREKCESIGGYVRTLRSISGCGKCGAWLFVHKVPFLSKEHVKTTQTDKTRFFFAKKRWTWYPTNNYYLMSRFNQPNINRNNCVWTTKYNRLSERCIVQHVKMKSVFTFQPIKRLVSTTVKSAKLAATFWIFLLRTKNRQLCCLVVTVHIVLQARRVVTTKKKNHLHFWRNFSTNHNQAHLSLNQKRLKSVQKWNKRIDFLLVDDLSHFFNFQIILFNFNLQSTSQFTANLQKIIMIFSDSNDRIQWTFDFGPDSVTVSVNDLDQNVTISSQEIPLAAWQLLFSQRQDFFNNKLAQVPITPNQQGTFEMEEEVLSSVGAHDLDTSSYQMSDLENIEFNWENSQLDMDAVFRPGIDTPFSPTTFEDLLMGDGSLENPIVLDEEEDKEIAPPTTPVSERPTEPPRLLRSRVFGARMENVPDYLFRNLFP